MRTGSAALGRRMLLAGAALGAILVGAGEGLARERVVWWYEGATPANQQSLDRLLIQPFNKSQEKYELVVEYRGSGLSNQLLVALSAKEGPDIVMTNGPAWTQRFVEGGRLLPLDAYAERYGWTRKFVPVMLETAVFRDKLYALPKNYETQVLYYNKSLFDKNGWTAPKTLAELDTTAAAMQKAGVTPIAGGNAGQRFVNRHYVGIVLNSYAGPEAVYQALKGDLPWNAPVFVEAITLLKSWWDKGWFGGQNYFSINNEQAFALMAVGRAGMALQGSWAFEWVPESFAKTGQKLDWVPLPKLKADAPYPVFPLGIGANLAINVASKVPDGAAMVLDRLSDAAMVEQLGSEWEGEWDVPLMTLFDRTTSGGDDVSRLAAKLRVDAAKAAVEGAYGYAPWTFWPARTDDFMKGGIEEVWIGKLTPKEFCDKVQEIFKQDLAEGLVKAPPPRS